MASRIMGEGVHTFVTSLIMGEGIDSLGKSNHSLNMRLTIHKK